MFWLLGRFLEGYRAFIEQLGVSRKCGVALCCIIVSSGFRTWRLIGMGFLTFLRMNYYCSKNDQFIELYTFSLEEF
jgi:hypothetical protein